MCSAYEDSKDLYTNQIRFQTLLSEKGLAPRILKQDIKARKDGMPFLLLVSEDAGLPIEDCDIASANEYLDTLYDMGIILHWYVDKKMFVKGFDGKIRSTDFKMTEHYDEPIGKHNRKYLLLG
jgi:hypothetical protein